MNPNPAFGAPAGSNAKDALNVPAVLLLVSGGIGVLTGLARMVMGAGDLSSNPAFAKLANDPATAEQAQQVARALSGPVNIVVNLLIVALSGFVIFGAVKMRNLQSHGLAVGAAIASLVPCTGCYCFGIPVGIWALVMLLKPEIKSQFQP